MAFRAVLERSQVLDFVPVNLRSAAQRQKQAPASMQPLPPVFERLELSNYTDVFLENGFDNWEDVLDITEKDLESLNVLRGHRRRLQREIANFKGVPIEQLLHSPGRSASLEATGDNSGAYQRSETGHAGSGTGKRRYRRHPKPDTNAPERPPSAYVLFSNKIRDQLKAENLSFTEMAKVVGEKWQQLDTDGREPFETEANDLKDTFNTKMIDYKKTDEWKEYQEYLTNFKATQQAAASGQGNEGKRLKLERSGDGSHGSSRGSQGTPATSAHGSPISGSQSLSNAAFTDGAPGNLSSPMSATPGGHLIAYQPPMPGRSGTNPATRPPVVGQTIEQQPLPSLSTEMQQRTLPRRGQNQPQPYQTRPQDSAPLSRISSTSRSSSSVYSSLTPVDSGQRSNSATSAELAMPYSQHQGLKSLNIGGRESPAYNHSSASPVRPSFPGPDAASRTLPPLPQQLPPPQRMDGLDALALAGRIIDGNSEARDLRPH